MHAQPTWTATNVEVSAAIQTDALRNLPIRWLIVLGWTALIQPVRNPFLNHGPNQSCPTMTAAAAKNAPSGPGGTSPVLGPARYTASKSSDTEDGSQMITASEC